MGLEDLTAESFRPHEGDRFGVSAPDVPAFDITLVSVTAGAEQGTARRQFSLIFRGGPDTPQPQSIYRLDHDELGVLEIFLVPIGPDAEGQCYEAVFT